MVNTVDRTALRVNAAGIIIFLALGYLFDQQYPVLFVALVMGLSAVAPQRSLFPVLYRRFLLPHGILKPDLREGDPLPHQFAQGLGSGLLFLALTALTNDRAVLGWSLALFIAALAAVQLVSGFCGACFLYYQLGRAGIIPTNPRPGGRQ